MAPGTFATGVSGIDTGRDDSLVPRLVFGVGENASLHPEGSLAIATAAILAFLWLELAQVLKNENGRSMLLGKLDNASAHLMRQVLIGMPDLVPDGLVILFPLGNDARLGTLACKERADPRAA
jgi:hypothetical protein